MNPLLLTLTMAIALVVHAPVRAEDAASRAVEVVAAGEPAPLLALRDRTRAMESRFAVSVRWTDRATIDLEEIFAPRGESEQVFARIWLDLTAQERAVLFIANARNDRVLVRVLPTNAGYGEITRESLANVMESALDTLLSGGQIGVERSALEHEIEVQTGTRVIAPPEPAPPLPTVEAKPEPEPIPPPHGSPARALSTTLSAQYRGDALMQGPELRHGAQIGLFSTGFFARTFDLMLGVTAHYFPPFTLGGSDRSVQQQGGGARGLVGACGQAGRFSWQAALGAGLDLARTEPAVAKRTGLAEAQPFLVTVPVVTALVSAGLRLSPWFELLTGAGLDLDLVGHHFDVQREEDRVQVITPWRLHPYWFVGLGFPLSRAGGEPR